MKYNKKRVEAIKREQERKANEEKMAESRPFAQKIASIISRYADKKETHEIANRIITKDRNKYLESSLSKEEYNNNLTMAKEQVNSILEAYEKDEVTPKNDRTDYRLLLEKRFAHSQSIVLRETVIDRLTKASQSPDSNKSTVYTAIEHIKKEDEYGRRISQTSIIELMSDDMKNDIAYWNRYDAARAKMIYELDNYFYGLSNGVRQKYEGCPLNFLGFNMDQDRYTSIRGFMATAPMKFFRHMQDQNVAWRDVIETLYYPVIDPDAVTTYNKDNMTGLLEKRTCYEFIGRRCTLSFDPDKKPLPIYKTDSQLIARALDKRPDSDILRSLLTDKVGEENPNFNSDDVQAKCDILLRLAREKQERTIINYNRQHPEENSLERNNMPEINDAIVDSCTDSINNSKPNAQ